MNNMVRHVGRDSSGPANKLIEDIAEELAPKYTGELVINEQWDNLDGFYGDGRLRLEQHIPRRIFKKKIPLTKKSPILDMGLGWFDSDGLYDKDVEGGVHMKVNVIDTRFRDIIVKYIEAYAKNHGSQICYGPIPLI